MIGRTIASYRILEKIGGGGMGVVYKAHDEKLDRDVALKFLPAHFADSESRKQRFIREARAASALDHPNVCTIYDINETDDGQLYIAMAYCAGVPLDMRIASGPLGVESAVAIAEQIASGLMEAHAAGIIHRDIKPGNIIVSADDAVKIVDFGLAKVSADTALTSEGTAVGTAAYMSPEQARGTEVDHRTDIWSLGAVLYEMLAARRPFTAAHDAAELYQIVNEEPPPVKTARSEVPDALAAIVHRMLAKEPEARYGAMTDVLAALGSLSAPAGSDAPGDTLARARAAFERQEWQEAIDAFRAADDEEALGPDDLVILGWVALWTSNREVRVDANERAHAAFVKAGRATDAARVAVTLAHEEFVSGRPSVCSGWLKRAERLLEDHPDAVENGYVARQRAQVAIEGDVDLDAALALADTAREYAERNHDNDLLALAMQDRGRALVLKDRVTEGMELLEEAMSLAMSGVVSQQIVGSTYCNLISMCDRIADYRRAGEWSDSAMRWCAPHRDSVFPGICSIRRADIMQVRGAWEDAESEVERTMAFCADRYESLVAEGYYLKGQIKLRRGDFDEADACFQEAHQRGRHPMPGLAMLRAAQGRLDAARSLMNRALEEDTVALQRIRFLPPGVDIALAAGDTTAARELADELVALASRYDSAVFKGQASYAGGTVALAVGDADGAVAALTEALAHWKAAGLPYDEARARVQLALAYWTRGDTDLADLEATSARTVFERLGARPDVERVDSLIERHA